MTDSIPPSGFEERVVPNKIRRVMKWLTIVSLVLGVPFIGVGIPVGIDADKKADEYRDAPLLSDWLDICIEERGANEAADVLILGGIGWFVLAVVFFLIFITRDKHKRQLGPATGT